MEEEVVIVSTIKVTIVILQCYENHKNEKHEDEKETRKDENQN